MPVTTTGGGRAGASAPTVPTTDLIQANPYPNLGTLPTWKATAGTDITCGGGTTDTGTGILPLSNVFQTFTEIGPTANKPFTFVRVLKLKALWDAQLLSNAETSFFQTFSSASIFIQSSNSGFLGGFTTTSSSTGYAIERVRRTSGGEIFYAVTGRTEVSVGTGLGAALFPIAKFKSGNTTDLLSMFLYSGDAGDLVGSGTWSQLAAWISANNFGASL